MPVPVLSDRASAVLARTFSEIKLREERLEHAQEIRIPTTDDELHAWVGENLGVWIPRKNTCKNHAAPFSAFADAFFARSRMAVWKASRGFGGKSFLLATLSLTEQILLGAGINLLGGSGEQSERVHGYTAGTDPNAAGMFWDAPNAPRWLLRSDPTKRETRLVNKGTLKALMASQRSVRGPHPQRLRLDEVDEMTIEIFNAAMGQTMSARGIGAQTVASSTHQNADGTMTEILKRAAENEWPIYEWCWRESVAGGTGWLMADEVEAKRNEIPMAMWETEYELQEPNPEGRAIDPDAVEALFDSDFGHFTGAAGETIVLPGIGPYYTGTDWAKSADWTIIHTMRRQTGAPDTLAAWTREGRKPWPLMIEAHDEQVKNHPGQSAHDATGVGEVCDDYLTVSSDGFDFRNGKARTEMLSNYIAAIENGDIVYPMIDYAYNEHRYATVDDIYGSGHLPDTIAAGALSWWARTRPVPDWTKVHTGRSKVGKSGGDW